MAKYILSSFDFFETIDSIAWAIASKPADALILSGAEIKKSGIRKNYQELKDYSQMNV